MAFPQSPSEKTEEPPTQASRRRYEPQVDKIKEPEDLPLSSSSPAEPSGRRDSVLSTPIEEKEIKSPSPLLKVYLLDKTTGAIPKTIPKANKIKKGETTGQSDGQHRDVGNCGCHTCVTELAIIRQEPLEEGKRITLKFREQLKKRIIYNHTLLKTHPTPFMCITYMERKSQQHMPIKLDPETNSKKGDHRKVSSLRSKFEEKSAPRVDPRTGIPPQKPKSTSSQQHSETKGERQNISVITSNR